MPTHLDLCSGIGGFSLAAAWCSYDTIGFCEIDGFCQRVLAKHWPGVPIHDDVRTLTGDVVRGWLRTTERVALDANGQAEPGVPEYGGARPRQLVQLDLLTAGYPCQPFSHAGKRLGQADDRHLWPEVARLVADLRPRWCLLENVAGHVSMGLDDVLADLEAFGYAWGAAVIPAAAVNAPHRRDRIWVVAHAAELGQTPGKGRTPSGAAAARRVQSERPSCGSRSEPLADAEGLPRCGGGTRGGPTACTRW